MVEFTITAESSAGADEVLASARDFSARRTEIWPNVSTTGYAVHTADDASVEVTEKALRGFVWERSRYEWPRPGVILQTVIDSNALVPGSTWELTVTSNAQGSHVEAVFRRGFRRTPQGLFGYLINRFAGKAVYGSDLRRALKTIEANPDRRQPG